MQFKNSEGCVFNKILFVNWYAHPPTSAWLWYCNRLAVGAFQDSVMLNANVQ